MKKVFSVLLLIIVAGCASVPKISNSEGEISSADQRAVERTLQYLGAHYSFVQLPQAAALLARVVARLESATPTLGSQNIRGSVYILKSNEPNAFSMKGGGIFLTSGLFVALRSESELAAVLAHELAHHLRGDTDCVSDSGSVFVFAEEDELAADAMSIRILSRARYEPSAALHSLAAFHRARMRKEVGIDRNFLESRILRLRDELNTLPPQIGATENSREFNHVRRMLAEASR